MKNSWKSFWDQYAEKAGDDPCVQVARTRNSHPMSTEMFEGYANHLMELLKLKSDHAVLDLCCGNGLLSTIMAKQSAQVIGVDFSEKLIENLELKKQDNITGIVSDALDVKFEPESFHRIVMAAALQHFTQAQTIQLFENMFCWLKPGGTLLVTDIADSDLMWDFYNSAEREEAYFLHTRNDTSAMGTWYNRVWLERLSKFTGFKKYSVLDQPNDYWYSHYRFDLICNK